MREVDRIFNSMVGKAGGYTGFCDWIASDGRGQYIDTGVTFNGRYGIEIDYLFYAGGAYFFGASNETALGVTVSNRSYYAITPNNNTYCSYGTGTTRLLRDTRYINTALSYTSRVSGANIVYTLTRLSDSTVYTNQQAVQTFDCVQTTTLFAIHQIGRINATPSETRLGSVRIYDDSDVLVRDYRPYVDNGTAGMLDVVNDVFYPSANGVNFLYGFF